MVLEESVFDYLMVEMGNCVFVGGILFFFFSFFQGGQVGHLLFFPLVLDCSVVTHHYLILSFIIHRFQILFFIMKSNNGVVGAGDYYFSLNCY